MITANNTRKLPKLDAIANEYEVLINCHPIRELPIMSMATPRLAPELIPSTNGPASGFLKVFALTDLIWINRTPPIWQ